MTEASNLSWLLRRLGAGCAVLLLAISLAACGGSGSSTTPPTTPPVGQDPDPTPDPDPDPDPTPDPDPDPTPDPDPDPDPDPADGETVEGTVSAPAAAMAAIQHRQQHWGLRLLASVADLFLPRAMAALDGLTPVTGGSVELIRVNNAGEQVGEVIATAPISATGSYLLTLPADLDLTANLVLRVNLGEDVVLRAVAAQRQTDIDPISEFILRSLVTAAVNLDSLSVNEVVRLRGQVEGFPVLAGGSLNQAIENLGNAAGGLLAQELEALKLPGLDSATVASVVAGDYRLASLEVMLGHRQVNGVNNEEIWTLGFTAPRELSFEATEADGEVRVRLGPVTSISGLGNFPSGLNGQLFIETELDDEDVTLPGRINQAGLITVDVPLREDILADADLAVRIFATMVRLRPFGGESIYGFAGLQNRTERLFGLNAQGGLDINQPEGRRDGIELLVGVRSSEGTPTLAPAYGLIEFDQGLTNGPCIETFASLIVLRKPEVVVAGLGEDDYFIEFDDTELGVGGCAPLEDDDPLEFVTMTGIPGGGFEVRVDDEIVLTGATDANGNLLLANLVEVSEDETQQASNIGTRILVGVPLCDDCPTLFGTIWDVVGGLGIIYNNGSQRLDATASLVGTGLRFGPGSDDELEVAIILPEMGVEPLLSRVVERVDGSVDTITEFVAEQTLEASSFEQQGIAGETVVITLDNAEYRGFISADGQLMILRGIQLDGAGLAEGADLLILTPRSGGDR